MFNKENKGFTFLEVLIAIAIISIGLMAGLALMTMTIASSSMGTSQLIAANLAQEGIEVVRNIRDDNWLDPEAENWKDGLPAGSGYVNWDSNKVKKTGSDELHLDVDNRYTHEAGTLTPFRRHIEITDAGDYLIVKSIVNWTERGRSHSITLEDHLYNWQ